MAELVGVINTSHAWIDSDPNRWDSIRAGREFRPDVPFDDDAAKAQKVARINSAVALLRAKLEELKPDVLVVFGDDQGENYSTERTIVPSLAVYLGTHFAGRGRFAKSGDPHQEVPGHPSVAVAILNHLLGHGFDPAYCMGLPNPEKGIGHAIMNPLGYFTDYTLPTVPILLNAIFAPQITATRAYEVGRTVRAAVDTYPEDLRVVAIGSGGLWHTGNSGRGTYLNEEFDRTGLALLESGDVKGWAAHFDGYQVPDGDSSQDISARDSQPSGATSFRYEERPTGMASLAGPQFGTRETINWIAASAVADGSPFTVLDYVPVYASPIGLAFAYCDQP